MQTITHQKPARSREQIEIAITQNRSKGQDLLRRSYLDLVEIEQRELFRSDYRTMNEYVQMLFSCGRKHAYRELWLARVISILSPIGDNFPPIEAHARALSGLTAEQVIAVVEKAGMNANAARLKVYRSEMFPFAKEEFPQDMKELAAELDARGEQDCAEEDDSELAEEYERRDETISTGEAVEVVNNFEREASQHAKGKGSASHRQHRSSGEQATAALEQWEKKLEGADENEVRQRLADLLGRGQIATGKLSNAVGHRVLAPLLWAQITLQDKVPSDAVSRTLPRVLEEMAGTVRNVSAAIADKMLTVAREAAGH